MAAACALSAESASRHSLRRAASAARAGCGPGASGARRGRECALFASRGLQKQRALLAGARLLSSRTPPGRWAAPAAAAAAARSRSAGWARAPAAAEQRRAAASRGCPRSRGTRSRSAAGAWAAQTTGATAAGRRCAQACPRRHTWRACRSSKSWEGERWIAGDVSLTTSKSDKELGANMDSVAATQGPRRFAIKQRHSARRRAHGGGSTRGLAPSPRVPAILWLRSATAAVQSTITTSSSVPEARVASRAPVAALPLRRRPRRALRRVGRRRRLVILSVPGRVVVHAARAARQKPPHVVRC